MKFKLPRLYTKYAFPCSICENVAADEKECLTCPAFTKKNNKSEEESRKEIEDFINGEGR